MSNGSFDAWLRAVDAALAARGSRLRVRKIDPVQLSDAFQAGQTPHGFAARDDLIPRSAAAFDEPSLIGRLLRDAGVAVWIMGAILSAVLWIDLAAERASAGRLERFQKALSESGAAERAAAAPSAQPPADWAEGVSDPNVAQVVRDFQRGFEEGQRAIERGLQNAARRPEVALPKMEDERASEILDGIVDRILLPPLAFFGCLAGTFALGTALFAAGVRWDEG